MSSQEQQIKIYRSHIFANLLSEFTERTTLSNYDRIILKDIYSLMTPEEIQFTINILQARNSGIKPYIKKRTESSERFFRANENAILYLAGKVQTSSREDTINDKTRRAHVFANLLTEFTENSSLTENDEILLRQVYLLMSPEDVPATIENLNTRTNAIKSSSPRYTASSERFLRANYKAIAYLEGKQAENSRKDD